MKSSMAPGIEFIKSEHDDILWLKFNKDQFNIKKYIYFSAVYITLPIHPPLKVCSGELRHG